MFKKMLIGAFYVHRSHTPAFISKASLPTPELSDSCIPMIRRNPDQPDTSHPTNGRWVSWLGLVLLSLAFSSEVLAQTQIVNCDAQVQSRKRGIAVNSMSAADFEAVAPGVSWYYNWGTTLDRARQCDDGFHPDGLERRRRLSNRPHFLSRGRKQALAGIRPQ